MRIAICDDDESFLAQTARLIDETLALRDVDAEVACFADAEALLASRAKGTAPDIYFLDVYLPGMDGIDLAGKIRETQPDAPVVFLTTSEAHALEANALDAVHYLVKPFEPRRFVRALDRALALLPRAEQATLLVKTVEGVQEALSLGDIVSVESEGHYECLRLPNGRLVRSRLSSAELWEGLAPSGLFVRAGKGLVLGLRHVRALAPTGVVMKDGSPVAVSRRALPEVREAFLAYNCQ